MEPIKISVVQDALLSEDEDVYRIVHTGFASNGLKASKQFFDYYRIPFTLYEYFESEMENPLFLTLYCKTYRNDEASLPTLYDRLVESANKNIFPILEKRYKLIGFTEDDNIAVLRPFSHGFIHLIPQLRFLQFCRQFCIRIKWPIQIRYDLRNVRLSPALIRIGQTENRKFLLHRIAE